MIIEVLKENMLQVPTMQQLLEAGVHFGHQTRRGHPLMAEYLYGARDGVHIINLEFSEKLLKEAADFAYKLGEEGKVLLFVGTKKQAQPIIKELAEKAGAPYITYKWVGGFLTNFDEIRKNLMTLKDLKDKQEKNQLSHYTKKERLLISRKLEKFELAYQGVMALEKLPDALFIVDCVGDKTAINESIRMGISTIGITDSNSNPHLIIYPIPGNDDATKSIKILSETIALAYLEGLRKAGLRAAPIKADKVEPATGEVKEDKKATKGKKAKETPETIEAKEDVVEGVDKEILPDVEAAYEDVEKKELEDSTRKV